MAIWKKIEQAIWTGEQIKEYGPFSQGRYGLAHRKISALLARRSGKDRFVIKVSHKATLAGSVWYIDLDRDGAKKLRMALDDALQVMK